MPTNTTEYQREYQREYRKSHTQKQYKKSKEVKREVKKVKVSNLVPPRAPVKVEKEVEGNVLGSCAGESVRTSSVATDSKTIDFSYLTNNHSFQMAILEFMKKFAPGLENIKVRGNKEVLKQSFNENANNYRNVMKELKQVLEMRKK